MPSASLHTHEPECAGEDDNAANEDRGIDRGLFIHPEHESEHDDRHRCSHQERHISSRLAEIDVVERLGVEIHQPEHDERGDANHGAEFSVVVSYQ